MESPKKKFKTLSGEDVGNFSGPSLPSADDPFLFIQSLRNRPFSFVGNRYNDEGSDEDIDELEPEGDEDPEQKDGYVSIFPAKGSLESQLLDQMIKKAAAKGKKIEQDDEKEVSILLEGTPRSKELLRNTALNSFLSAEKPTETKIKKRIEEIRLKESEHIQATNMQKTLQSLYASNSDDLSILDLFAGTIGDEESEDEDGDFNAAEVVEGDSEDENDAESQESDT